MLVSAIDPYASATGMHTSPPSWIPFPPPTPSCPSRLSQSTGYEVHLQGEFSFHNVLQTMLSLDKVVWTRNLTERKIKCPTSLIIEEMQTESTRWQQWSLSVRGKICHLNTYLSGRRVFFGWLSFFFFSRTLFSCFYIFWRQVGSQFSDQGLNSRPLY